jgi:hypothetical protein
MPTLERLHRIATFFSDPVGLLRLAASKGREEVIVSSKMVLDKAVYDCSSRPLAFRMHPPAIAAGAGEVAEGLDASLALV